MYVWVLLAQKTHSTLCRHGCDGSTRGHQRLSFQAMKRSNPSMHAQDHPKASRRAPMATEGVGVNDQNADVHNIHDLMAQHLLGNPRKIFLPYYARYKVRDHPGVWQLLCRGASPNTWSVAPYDCEDMAAVPRPGSDSVFKVSEADLCFAPKTVLAGVNWHISSMQGGKLKPGGVQQYQHNEFVRIDITVGSDPHKSRLLIYLPSTENETSAIHSNIKRNVGDGALSLLEDFTIVTIYWKGVTNKTSWQVQAPRSVFGMISELLELYAGQPIPGVMLCSERPDIWGYSRRAMTVMHTLR